MFISRFCFWMKEWSSAALLYTPIWTLLLDVYLCELNVYMNPEHNTVCRECTLPSSWHEAVEPKDTKTYNAGQQNNTRRNRRKREYIRFAHAHNLLTGWLRKKTKKDWLNKNTYTHTEKSERWRKRRARKCVVLKKFCLECVPLVLVTRNNISIQLNAEILLCIWHIHSLKIAHWNDVLQSEIVYKFMYTLMCHIGDDTTTAAISDAVYTILECEKTMRERKLKHADLNTVRFSRFHFTC